MDGKLVFILALITVGFVYEGECHQFFDCKHPAQGELYLHINMQANILAQDEQVREDVRKCASFLAEEEQAECPVFSYRFPEEIGECNKILDRISIKDVITRERISAAMKYVNEKINFMGLADDCDEQWERPTADYILQEAEDNAKIFFEIYNNAQNSDFFSGAMKDSEKMENSKEFAPIKTFFNKLVKSHGKKFITTFLNTLKKFGISEDGVNELMSCLTQAGAYAAGLAEKFKKQ